MAKEVYQNPSHRIPLSWQKQKVDANHSGRSVRRGPEAAYVGLSFGSRLCGIMWKLTRHSRPQSYGYVAEVIITVWQIPQDVSRGEIEHHSGRGTLSCIEHGSCRLPSTVFTSYVLRLTNTS